MKGAVRMDDNTRLILLNQFEILSKLEPEENYYSRCRDILQNGYEYLYSDIKKHISDPMPSKDGEFVFDVLQMYREITTSYNRLKDKEGLTEEDIAFQGFDGNEEVKYYLFTCFLIEDDNRFIELKENPYFSLNSHCDKIHEYSRMLNVWQTNFNRYNTFLGVRDIKQILEA